MRICSRQQVNTVQQSCGRAGNARTHRASRYSASGRAVRHSVAALLRGRLHVVIRHAVIDGRHAVVVRCSTRRAAVLKLYVGVARRRRLTRLLVRYVIPLEGPPLCLDGSGRRWLILGGYEAHPSPGGARRKPWLAMKSERPRLLELREPSLRDRARACVCERETCRTTSHAYRGEEGRGRAAGARAWDG